MTITAQDNSSACSESWGLASARGLAIEWVEMRLAQGQRVE